MHFGFIPYGKRSCVELLLRDMDAHKHLMSCTKGKKKKNLFIQGQVRILPGGVYEYVFPKEDLDKVLTTMIPVGADLPYGISGKWLFLARKLLKFEKIPEFKKDKKFFWIKDHVSIIPLGIRKDEDIVGTRELDKGWTHEGI